MKAAVLCADAPSLSAAPSRLADYVALTKPRIAVLVLFTVAAGALLAAGRTLDPWIVLHAVVGTGLVAAGASAWNQYLERHSDARMRRTESRPLPAGRLQPGEVAVFGTALAAVGVGYLYAALRQPVTPLLAAGTFVAYVFIYTPLKRRTTLNAFVGAVPGAMPPLIGWSAATGSIGMQAWFLPAVVFLWQVPHFLAIAWIYREDYARAGMKMLPAADPEGRMAARQSTVYTLTLVVVSLTPGMSTTAGPIYLVGALLLGLFFLSRTSDFSKSRSTDDARRVLHASLIYLPALLALLLIDRLI